MPIEAGLAGSAELTVSDADTAASMQSGDVPALATPRVLALCEEASCAAVHDHLDEGTTTVGFRVQLDHVAGVKVGTAVWADAVLERIEGRRLTFTVSVKNASGLVAVGKVTRVMVERATFLDKLH